MRTPIRNVVFDLGGVVFDWNPAAIIRSVFDEPAVQARVKELVFDYPDWADTDRGTLSKADAVRRWAARTGYSVAEMTALANACDLGLSPKADTLALLDELHGQGVHLYCLSNMPLERWAYLQRAHDFWPKFRGIVISGHVKLIKPEPAIYRYLLDTHGLSAVESLFLDDMVYNVDAARRLGMHGIVFTSASQCRAEMARFFDFV